MGDLRLICFPVQNALTVLTDNVILTSELCIAPRGSRFNKVGIDYTSESLNSMPIFDNLGWVNYNMCGSVREKRVCQQCFIYLLVDY